MFGGVSAAACRQEEGVSVPAAGVYGDGQQSQLAIQIRVGRVGLLWNNQHFLPVLV